MQCAGMIGEAVGRTRFKNDGLEIMTTLVVSHVPIPTDAVSLERVPPNQTRLLFV